MKLMDVKFGMAVKCGDKEVNYASSIADQRGFCYDIELVFRPELNMAVVQLSDKRTDSVAWTSFANVVYCRPVGEKIESSDSKKRPGASKAAASVASVTT